MGHAAHETGAAVDEAEGQAGEAARRPDQEGGHHQFVALLGGELVPAVLEPVHVNLISGRHPHLRGREDTSSGIWPTHTIPTSHTLHPALGRDWLSPGPAVDIIVVRKPPAALMGVGK